MLVAIGKENILITVVEFEFNATIIQWRIQGEGDGGDRPSQDGKINMGEIGIT